MQDCYLVSILNELAGNSFIIFCSTCNNAQRLALLLRNLGITAIPLHGQMSQVRVRGRRSLAFKPFRKTRIFLKEAPPLLSSTSEQASRSSEQVQGQVALGAAGYRRGVARTRHPSRGLRDQLRHPHSFQGTVALAMTSLTWDLNTCLTRVVVGLHPSSWTHCQSRKIWEVHHLRHPVGSAQTSL